MARVRRVAPGRLARGIERQAAAQRRLLGLPAEQPPVDRLGLARGGLGAHRAAVRAGAAQPAGPAQDNNRGALVNADPHIEALAALARGHDGGLDLRQLVAAGLDRLPLPGSGQTLARWRMLAEVAALDLSLAKLFEGHTDALAILAE